jgi:protein tyrosine phosphatase (PTP) superfamily phosphohydrolase (DUF442 family)
MQQTLTPVEPAPCGGEKATPVKKSIAPILIKGIALAVLVMFVAECLRIFVGSNLHTVVPGKCFRSAQPTAASLENLKRTQGIRSVINLRDENEHESWYQQEKQAADQLGVTLFNAGLCSNEQVPDYDFHRFVQAMKDAPEPILIHCANGNDRTGLASAVYLLLRTDTSPAQARKQLSLRYGHFSWTRTGCLTRILDNYEGWLAQEGKTHRSEHFYHWGMHVYQPEVVN